MRLRPWNVAVLPLLAIPVFAQSKPQLIGLTAGAPATLPPQLLRQSFGDCTIARCGPQIRETLSRVGGGTAHDSIASQVWITNGVQIMAVDPLTCNTTCQVIPVPLPANAVATGLAVNENKRVLLLSDSANNIHQFRLTCPINTTIQQACNVTLPAGYTIGGLATDDVNDLVLIAASSFSTAVPGNFIAIARRGAACTPFCRIPVPSCGPARLGPLTGLAFDPCTRVAWATDGTRTVGLRIDLASCTATEIQCCSLPITTDRYVGLCVLPSLGEPLGQPCTNGSCPTCPALAHTLIGDAAMGNPDFKLNLSGAPANSNAWLLFNGGPCTPPGLGLPPILCGRIFVPILGAPIPPIVIGPLPTGGTVACTGGVSVAVPIPLTPSFCGQPLSSQFLGLCAGPTFGTYLSNCVSWMVSGS